MAGTAAREGTIATRRTASRLCTTLAAAALVAALVLALLPGTPSACGSLLAPAYPPSAGVACAGAQGTWIPAIGAAVVIGLLLAVAGAALSTSRRTRRRR